MYVKPGYMSQIGISHGSRCANATTYLAKSWNPYLNLDTYHSQY